MLAKALAATPAGGRWFDSVRGQPIQQGQSRAHPRRMKALFLTQVGMQRMSEMAGTPLPLLPCLILKQGHGYRGLLRSVPGQESEGTHCVVEYPCIAHCFPISQPF
jgi:hypothetical protein